MQGKKPVRKPELMKGCESCEYRNGEFETDTIDPKIIRSYCRARHVKVDSELMSRECDFWKIVEGYEKPKPNNRYGL